MPLAGPQLLPSAPEVLALLLMALEVGSEVEEVACVGVDCVWHRLGQVRGRCVSREVGGRGVTEQIKENRAPGPDGQGICSCSQGCMFGILMGGLGALFRHPLVSRRVSINPMTQS